ncbi:MAG TPA: polysaccharide deacetylase family protein [Candidatus Dormibacteraeota bacterium]|nr:polysaccharide deacetylase family protein [Candidatus Dormibacteraeota bacterium]
MGRWTQCAGRWAVLTSLLLVAALVPHTGLIPTTPLGAAAVVEQSGIAGDADERNSLIALRRARATPSASPSIQQLVLAELNPKKAPVPSGPVTYVPILYYHYIRINPIASDKVGYGLSTTPTAFAAQMQYLANHGFHVISLHQAVVAIKNHSGLPSRPVVLTFDDGYADFFTAAIPVLRSHGFTATNFVISGHMGYGGYMTPSQVVAADGMGFTIGAHTVDHVALAAQSPARAAWEIKQSKLTLEGLLGHPVLDFAYPYGSYNAYDEAQAKSDGFETAASTFYGSWHSAGQLYFLSRLRIGGGLPLTYFANVVGGPPPTAAELRGTGTSPTASASPTAKPTATPAPSPSASPSASPA